MKYLWMFPMALVLGCTAVASPATDDLLVDLAPGLRAKALVRAGDLLSDGTRFPEQNDFTAYFPTSRTEGLLLVGHELRWGTDPFGGRFTRLRLAKHEVVASQIWVSGMHNNCAGTVTPWNTILSGEEYPVNALPAEERAAAASRRISPTEPAASFGWIYEIDPFGENPAGKVFRRTALGRYSHESAAVVSDTEVYLTEDAEQGYLYRFTASRPRDLSEGALHAYDRKGQRWLPIKDVFNARWDAKSAGATPFNRLEDIRQGPDGMLYIAETGDPKESDPYGRVLRLDPKTNRMDSYLEGDGKRMANPDNLIFDRQGHLLICEDQYGQNLNAFGPNEILRVGSDKALTRVLSVIRQGEPTGPSFSPDGKTLFFSVMAGPKSAVLAVDGF